MLLYHQIRLIEKWYPPFNRQPLTVHTLKELANQAKITVIEDFSVTTAVSFRYKKRKLIYFNPHQPYQQQVLCLGHEIGHFLLGHHDAWELYFNPLSVHNLGSRLEFGNLAGRLSVSSNSVGENRGQ